MSSVLSRVVDCIAVATRYPKQLLTPDADLESDLGIDSVKRVEIVAVLADEFKLDLMSQERSPSTRTVQNVAEWIERELAKSSAMPSPPETPTDSAPQEQSVVPVRNDAPSGAQSRFDERHSLTMQAPISGRVNPLNTHVERTEALQPQKNIGDSGGMSLEGRVALVTGSGRGVGRVIARLLASRGATVIINSFHSRDLGDQTAAEINASGGSAIHLWGSVANPGHVDGIFDQIGQRFGFLDMLICNASDGKIGSFSELSQDDWDRAFRTNVSGHHHCAMRASQLMQSRGGGSITTISAVGAHHYVEGLGSQGVVKAAVETLTKYLACELAPIGVRSNCVCGGPVYGDLLSKFPHAQKVQQQFEAVTPGGELTQPMDLAETICFLVSDAARGINGAVLQVDQGLSAVLAGRVVHGLPAKTASTATY